MQAAVDLARPGGSMCLIGLADTDASITPGTWLVKEINVAASLAYFHEVSAAGSSVGRSQININEHKS